MSSALPIDLDALLDFLVGLLNVPSPTGFTERAIDYVEARFQPLGLALRRTVKGALVMEWAGRAADAPRAASSIRSNSIRCSCTGGTSGWITKTSRSRQLALSCTYRQSLLKRRIVVVLKPTSRQLHTSDASSGCALPVKTTTCCTMLTPLHFDYFLTPAHSTCASTGKEATALPYANALFSNRRSPHRPPGPGEKAGRPATVPALKQGKSCYTRNTAGAEYSR